MEKMFNDRNKYKKLMIEAEKEYEQTKDPEWSKKISAYHNLQLAKKIQLNSACSGTWPWLKMGVREGSTPPAI